MYLTLLNMLLNKHISHIRPNHLSGYTLVPIWPDNRGRTVTHTPRSDGSPVCRGQFGEVLIFYDRPSTRSSNAPACRGQSRLSGFCCAHRLCVRSPCQHISRMRTFDENSCAISITSPKFDFRPRNPTCLVGTRGQVPASVHTMWLPGKVPLGGTFPAKRGPVWTGGQLYGPNCIMRTQLLFRAQTTGVFCLDLITGPFFYSNMT